MVILCVAVASEGEGTEAGFVVCADEWQAVVRKEDVRATEKEKVVCAEGFRVGDLVRAVVVCAPLLSLLQNICFDSRSSCARTGRYNTFLGWGGMHSSLRLGFVTDIESLQISLGDQSNYYLTTAKNELGVIMAKSEAGNTMFPISWKDFKDPETGETEMRKVAKPV